MKPISPIFDLGGVLVEWQPAQIARQFSADPALQQRILEGVFQHPDWVEKDRGSLSVPELERRFSARTQLAPAEIRRLMGQVRASLQIKADTLAWVQELKADGYPLYCLSNMPSDHEAYLRQRHDFWALFDGIVTSHRVGLVKPEPAIFEHLLQEFGLDPRSCVFIDDGPDNIRIAQSLGIHGVLFSGAASARRAFEQILERFA